MRDISPGERAVLERAAEHVEVFERVSSSGKRDFERGCFDCAHPVGSMSPDNSYCTILFYANHIEPANKILGVTVSPSDMFWERNRHHWFEYAIQPDGYGYPHWTLWYCQPEDLESGPEVYARLYSVTPNEVRHSNSRISVEMFIDDFVEDTGESIEELVVVSTPYKSYYGLYVVPSAEYENPGEDNMINADDVRCTPIMLEAAGRLWDGGVGPNLKPIRPSSRQHESEKLDYGFGTGATWGTYINPHVDYAIPEDEF